MESLTQAFAPEDLERRKLDLEERKVEIELDKIRIEKIKAWAGSASTFGSLLVVAATVALGIWSQWEQAKLQHDLQDRQAKAQFELKAAEIVMGTSDPGVTLNKAKALQSLFPQYLSTNFADSFVPETFARTDESPEKPAPARTAAPVYRKATVSAKPTSDPEPNPEQEFAFNNAKKFTSGKLAYKKSPKRKPSPVTSPDPTLTTPAEPSPTPQR